MSGDNLKSFIQCKDESKNKKDFLSKSLKDSNSSADIVLNKIISKNNECIMIGHEALTEIKGNEFEKMLNKAIKISIDRMGAENKLYLYLQQKITVDDTVKKDTANNMDMTISLLIRREEESRWNDFNTEIQKKESNTPKKNFFDLPTIIIISAVLIWAWVAGKQKQEDILKRKDDDNTLKKIIDDYRNKK